VYFYGYECFTRSCKQFQVLRDDRKDFLYCSCDTSIKPSYLVHNVPRVTNMKLNFGLKVSESVLYIYLFQNYTFSYAFSSITESYSSFTQLYASLAFTINISSAALFIFDKVTFLLLPGSNINYSQ